MKYIERTLLIRNLLRTRPDILDHIRKIFKSHVAKDGNFDPIGKGGSRWAYTVGQCANVSGTAINLLLKLRTNSLGLTYPKDRNTISLPLHEFGAMETYYDFVNGLVTTLEFRNQANFDNYVKSSAYGNYVKFAFSLSEKWGGTQVNVGDIGAIPYFQLAVRFGSYFGILTEGEPPCISPLNTARDSGTLDDDTVLHGRIIDLGPTQCLLIDMDKGGLFSKGNPDNLGIMLRGKKYFDQSNRLDL